MAKETDYEKIDLPTNPNLPPWILTPKEEKLIFQRWRKRTFEKCSDLISKYIDCSNSYPNPLDAMKFCKEANDAQLGCVHEYQKIKYLDDERDILIKEKIEKKKQLEGKNL